MPILPCLVNLTMIPIRIQRNGNKANQSLILPNENAKKANSHGAYSGNFDLSDVFVGMVPLKETLFDELNDYVIRQQIQYDACDILVEAKNTTGEVAVPREVNKLLKYIDCKLTYTCSA